MIRRSRRLRRGNATIVALVAALLLVRPARAAAPLIGTSTAGDPMNTGSKYFTHYTNGHYWVAFDNGGVGCSFYSSPDGVTWTSQGTIFTVNPNSFANEWAVRYLGNTIIAAAFDGTNTRYYRSGTLNNNGTVSWSAQTAAGPADATFNSLSLLIANGRPIMWRDDAAAGGGGAFWRGSAIASPTWTKTAANSPAMSVGVASIGIFTAGAVFQTGGASPDDLIVLRATTVTPYPGSTGSNRLVAMKWNAGTDTYDASWYNVSTLGGTIPGGENATTEVQVNGDNPNQKLFAAVRDSTGNVHAVYVNRNGDMVHYEKTVGFNNSWSRISPGINPPAENIDMVALTALPGGNLYLFYSKGDKKIYYRRLDGATWGGESLLQDVSATNLRGALAPMESASDCSVGLAFIEGSGTFNIRFTLGVGSCSSLHTSEGAGTVTVEAPGSFEMTFDTVYGGGIHTFFDLAEDPANDLAGGAANHTILLTEELQSAGTWYRNDGGGAQGQKLDLLEATSTRMKVRAEAFFKENPTNVLRGLKAVGDYSVYPSGRTAIEWSRSTTVLVPYNDDEILDLVVHHKSLPDVLGNWVTYSETGLLPPNQGGGAQDFLLSQIEQTGVKTDFLLIRNQDWAIGNGIVRSATPAEESLQVYWDTNVLSSYPAGYSDVASLLLYFKPTSFIDHNDNAVKSRRDDYRSPDVLSGFTAGGGWLDLDEYTSAGDFYNEAEAAYALELNPVSGLTFDISGSALTPRHAPVFKIRQWRSLQDPQTVTVAGATKTNDVDYKADVKPISRAHWAQDLLWHSTLQTAGAVTAPDVGSAGAVGGGAGFVLARYGSGASVPTDGDWIEFPTAGNFDKAKGAIEFWFQPTYDSTDGIQRDIAGFSVDASNGWFLQKTLTDNRLHFRIVAGVTCDLFVLPANYSWRAYDWVHLRLEWDDTAPPGTQQRLFINGSEPAHTNPVSDYNAASLSVGPIFYLGNNNNGSPNFGPGIYDEFRSYGTSASTPALLAYGGLTTNGSENLADLNRNFTMSFTAVDASRRGRHLYLGSDSEFRGLNVALATAGAGTAPDLQWQYWDGTAGAWASLETGGFTDQTNNLTKSGTIYWTADPANWAQYSVNGGPDLYYVRAYLASGNYATQAPIEAVIKTDILLFQYCADVNLASQTFSFTTPPPTAVALSSFEARGLEGSVELTWRTASELKNLGFHLYRAGSAEGPYERITERAIPGLGSSPSGADYRYVDAGLTNGTTYYYELEDIETSGKAKRHGPVSATAIAGVSPSPGSPPVELTHGDPTSTSIRVVERNARGVLLELVTPGFTAAPEADGSVRISIPGFAEAEPGSPGIPVLRSWVELESGRGVRITSVRAEQVEVFSSLRPAAAGAPDAVATRFGTVVAGRRARREGASFRGPGLYPEELARLVEVGYQGEAKKALVELSPLRWNRTTGELVLARRLLVRLAFSGRDTPSRGRRAGDEARTVARRLSTRERGLYGVSLDELLGRGRNFGALRLSRQGETVAIHVEPASSMLYFVSEGASANPYGDEAVYELELKAGGATMPAVPASPSGTAVSFYWQTEAREENRYYQAGLVEAGDRWFWDLLFAPVSKSYPFEVTALASTPEPARVSLWLQGVSDLGESPDHHLRLSVNGTFLSESTFDGKNPLEVTAEIPAGALREGENSLEIENVGDTGASYSMVMLDRFTVSYPRRLVAEAGLLEGSFSASGVAEVQGLGGGAFVLDVSQKPERWLGTKDHFSVEAGRRYLVVSPGAVRKPELEAVPRSQLRSSRNRADYLVIGPESFLDAVEPLLAQRRSQGLRSRAVSIEDVYSAFGFGETRPEAIREFLSYAYHHWQKPSPRYVLLVGDGTYDFKDNLKTGVKNQVPPLMVKTSYLWTASDSSYAAVNGEDILPDIAIGRLPAASVGEARVMVEKILIRESSGSFTDGPFVLAADNADEAGDFEAGADDIAATVLAGREPRKIYLSRLGAEAARNEIVMAFDEGAGLWSYLGHGGIHLWAQEDIFDTPKVSALAPQPQVPLVLTMNCLNGYFHFPYFDSLAEALVKAEGKGAVAAFSPSGLSLDEPAHLYHRLLLSELLSGRHRRLGDAVLAAQAAYADSGAFSELLRIYLLLGDPAMSLR